MSSAAYFLSFVNIVLLRFILIVSSPAVLVLVFTLYSSLSPPTVSLIRLISSFCSQIPQQKRVYVIFFPMGTCILQKTLIVSDSFTLCVPSACFPTPFNSFSNSFADNFCHHLRVCLLKCFISCL